MDISALGQSATDTIGANSAASGLGSEDFLQLLITQLTNQDPLEPTSNEDIMRQIASLREIELNTGLTESLKTLTGQQRYASASSLIGQFVIGQAGEGELPVSGVVSAVRFDTTGGAMLELESGEQLPLERLGAVMNSSTAADQFIGKLVTAVDSSQPNDPRVVEGIVTAVREGDTGEVLFDLDTGQEVRLADVVAAVAADDPFVERQ